MLKKYYPYEYAKSVFTIDYKKLYDKGYRGVIFDIDNTLVHHGDNSNAAVDNLFVHIHNCGLKTVLLSNNDTERIERFIKNIDTKYICDADKPDTKGFYRAVEVLGISKDKAVYIGDQIFTDIVGANNSGIHNILVEYIKEENETKIGIKRNLEKIILRFYKLRKKYQNRIGDIYKEEVG